jgi:hypothetical protein
MEIIASSGTIANEFIVVDKNKKPLFYGAKKDCESFIKTNSK